MKHEGCPSVIRIGSEESLKVSTLPQRAGYSMISSELTIANEKQYMPCISTPIEANAGDAEMVVLKLTRVALKILICC
jgi:hypothetical protein